MAVQVVGRAPRSPIGGNGYYQQPAPAYAYAPGQPGALLGRDAYRPAAAAPAAGAGNFQIAGMNTSMIGWIGGALAGAFWALPKLARYGPTGFFTGAIVILGCGYYGSRTVGAAESALGGNVHQAVEVGAWFGGATVAANLISGWRNPGALVAAFCIWAGSWAAGKILNAVWPN